MATATENHKAEYSASVEGRGFTEREMQSMVRALAHRVIERQTRNYFLSYARTPLTRILQRIENLTMRACRHVR